MFSRAEKLPTVNIPKHILPLPSLKKSRAQIFDRLTRNIFQGACKRKDPYAEQPRRPMERRTIETDHISTVSSLGKMNGAACPYLLFIQSHVVDRLLLKQRSNISYSNLVRCIRTNPNLNESERSISNQA